MRARWSLTGIYLPRSASQNKMKPRVAYQPIVPCCQPIIPGCREIIPCCRLTDHTKFRTNEPFAELRRSATTPCSVRNIHEWNFTQIEIACISYFVFVFVFCNRAVKSLACRVELRTLGWLFPARELADGRMNNLECSGSL